MVTYNTSKAVMFPLSCNQAGIPDDDSDVETISLGTSAMSIDTPRATPSIDLGTLEDADYDADSSSLSITCTSTASAPSNDSFLNIPIVSSSRSHNQLFSSKTGNSGPIRTQLSAGDRRVQPYGRNTNPSANNIRRSGVEADLSRLNANDRSSLSIIQRFNTQILARARQELRDFERNGIFEVGRNNDDVEMLVLVESLRIDARLKNNSLTELCDPLERIPYDQDSVQEFDDDKLNYDYAGAWWGDGEPMTGGAIKSMDRSAIEEMLGRYRIPLAPTPSLKAQRELWLRFIGASEELIRKVLM